MSDGEDLFQRYFEIFFGFYSQDIVQNNFSPSNNQVLFHQRLHKLC